MRGLVLRLKGTYCPDGVELVRWKNHPDIAALRYGASGPDWFACRSERQSEIRRDAVDLGDALAVRFVNATDDDKRIAFLSRFGLPDHSFSFVGIGIAEARNIILGRQRILRRLLQDAGSGDKARARKAANESLLFAGARFSLDQQDRLVWTMQNLMDFMYMEVAVAAANGARLGSCKRCGDFFLYGKSTRRRSSATYCSDRCRVGAHRNKLNQKGA
jgi:hypothetical protein